MGKRWNSPEVEALLKRVAGRIKALRKAKHLRQLDMADFLEITERHYRLCETGKIDWPLSKIIALSQFFKVPISYIVEEPGEE